MKMFYLIYLNFGNVFVKRIFLCEVYFMCIEYFWLVEGFFNKMDDCLIFGDCREVCEWCVKSWYVFGEFIVYVFFVVVIDYLV